MYPDQSLYPADSVPKVVKKINRALIRADHIETVEGKNCLEYLAPMVVDAEAGGGHLGGKVLVPTPQFIKTLTSARPAYNCSPSFNWKKQNFSEEKY